MKKIDKKAHQEPRYDKSHLTLLGIVVALIAVALIVGGVWLFVKGVLVAGVVAKIWRIILSIVMVLLGLPFGVVAFMMLATASAMIKVKDGNVSDVGNSGKGTVNILKCQKCGAKLNEDNECCTKCGTRVDAVKKCQCGAKNILDATHCKKCGKEL